jgi:hypothetical protein
MAVMITMLPGQMGGLAAAVHMHNPQALGQQAKEIMVAQGLAVLRPFPVVVVAVLARQEAMLLLQAAPQEQVAQEQHLQLLAPL